MYTYFPTAQKRASLPIKARVIAGSTTWALLVNIISVILKTSVPVQANKKWLTLMKTLAYYVTELITAVISFMMQAQPLALKAEEIFNDQLNPNH